MSTNTILGRAFAGAGAGAQAEVLNTAGNHLFRICESEWAAEMQCAHVAEQLNDMGWKLLRCLMQFDPKREVTP